MIRYVPMRRPPKAWVSETEPAWQERPSVTVWERDNEPVETGLLDAHGTKLYRVREREPIGFRLRRD